MNLSTVRILWGAILFSTFLELGVVLWGDFDRHVDLQLEITLALSGAAVSSAIASIVVPSRAYAAALTRLALPTIESPLQKPGLDYRTAAGSERVFQGDARSAIVRVYQTPFILGLALTESIALFGFVIAQGRYAPSSYGLPFFALSWLLLGLRFPRESTILGPAERIYSASFPR